MQLRLRRATLCDLTELMRLEASCFDTQRRSNPETLQRSIQSLHQEVWVHSQGKRIICCLILRLHLYKIRIFSVAVLNSCQGRGYGNALMQHAMLRARQRNAHCITLEADARDRRLLRWYRKQGYVRLYKLPHYYAPNRPAWRMQLNLSKTSNAGKELACC